MQGTALEKLGGAPAELLPTADGVPAPALHVVLLTVLLVLIFFVLVREVCTTRPLRHIIASARYSPWIVPTTD